ncbi:MAG: ANTAR domain-containing protein [Actinobacteria bacterium]|nr:ANTAR domain-containing protein [Actinomycetota bacterium]
MRIAVAFAREAALSPSARLCRACRDVLHVTGAGLTLMAGRSRGPLCATSPVVGALEEIQFTSGEGPCRDAHESQGSVHAPSLDEAAFARWPSFVELARRSGIGGVFAYPLAAHGSKVRVMTLYQRDPGDLTAEQDVDSLSLTEVLAETVLSLQGEAKPGELGPGLDGGTLYRAEIDQAAGMVAVQLRIPVADALMRLRGHALAHDVSLAELASSIVARRFQLDSDEEDSASGSGR